MAPSGIITLTTDFGCRDSYVAEMKGVILCLNPDARLIDVSHQIPAGNIPFAAQIIRDSCKRFPSGTVHLAVIDPGVGTDRRPIAIAAADNSGNRHFFVGPDNGLFSLAVAPQNGLSLLEVRQISHLDRLPRVAKFSTFDGRDIFAPAAALLSAGRSIDYLGSTIEESSLAVVTLPPVRVGEDGVLHGEIVYVDHYGNAISNIKRPQLEAAFGADYAQAAAVSVPGKVTWANFVGAYALMEMDAVAAVINSKDFLELAVRDASARARLGLDVGCEVTVAPRLRAASAKERDQ